MTLKLNAPFFYSFSALPKLTFILMPGSELCCVGCRDLLGLSFLLGMHFSVSFRFRTWFPKLVSGLFGEG